MSFVLFEYHSMWDSCFGDSLFGVWFFKFTSYEGPRERNRALFALASAKGQPVLDLFWIRILSFNPDKVDWDDPND